MRDESSLLRQWTLLTSLITRRYGLTVQQMASDTGVTPKTIRRDLDTFRRVGFILEETVGEFGRKTWRIKGDGQLPALTLTFEEAAALEVARRRLEPMTGTPFHEAACRAFQKIRATLSETARNYIDGLDRFFHQTTGGAADYSEKSEIFETLQVASEDQKAVHILYQSDHATEPAYRDVYPLGLVRNKEWYYLIALDPQSDKIKHYKLDRIEAVEISSFPFHRPKDFCLADHLGPSFGIFKGEGGPTTIRVRFAPSVARFVQESKRHETQRLTKQRDGSLLAEFRLSSTEEFKGWIMSFGAKAIVLEPDSLRREIREDLERLLAAYSSPNGSAARPLANKPTLK